MELDQGEHLPGDVAVLAPTADLVVVELGIDVPERGRLRVLVDRALPPHRRDTAEPAAAVDDRDRAVDLAGELARRVVLAFDGRLALVATALQLLLRLRQAGVRVREHSHPEEHDDQRRDQRSEREPRKRDVGGTRDVQCAPLVSKIGEPATARDRDDRRAGAERAARHLDRLLGVARVRDRERERAGAHERRRAVVLEHGERDRERGGSRGLHHVARDTGSAHAQHHDVVDVRRLGQRAALELAGAARARARAARAARTAPRRS